MTHLEIIQHLEWMKGEYQYPDVPTFLEAIDEAIEIIKRENEQRDRDIYWRDRWEQEERLMAEAKRIREEYLNGCRR